MALSTKGYPIRPGYVIPLALSLATADYFTGHELRPAIVDLAPTFLTIKANGLGLGLSIYRSVIEMRGGRVWHGVNAEGGSSFHFVLPCGEA